MILNIDAIKEDLMNNLSNERYIHSLLTADMAVAYAKFLNVDESKAYLAGLVHDCAKFLSAKELIKECKKRNLMIDKIQLLSPELLHGYVGSLIAYEKYGIEDADMLSSIRFHTTGKPNMTNLEKIIFLADLTEQGRDIEFKDASTIRQEASVNFNHALIMAFDDVISSVIQRGRLLHFDTISARNYIISGGKIAGGDC